MGSLDEAQSVWAEEALAFKWQPGNQSHCFPLRIKSHASNMGCREDRPNIWSSAFLFWFYLVSENGPKKQTAVTKQWWGESVPEKGEMPGCRITDSLVHLLGPQQLPF